MIRAWGRSMKLQGWGNVWRLRREAQGSLAPTLGEGGRDLPPSLYNRTEVAGLS